jgi:hypothetical protein
VDESWFELPEDAQERMERFFVDGLGFKKIKRKSAVENDCSIRREE